MALSNLRKYKMITGTDLMVDATKLRNMMDNGKDLNNFTDILEDVYLGLSLANEPDVTDSKKKFTEHKKTGEMFDYQIDQARLGEMINEAL